MSYTIRKSTMDDLPVILNLRDQAREIMRSYGNTFQWPDGYPRDDMFKKDIKSGGSHVMLNEKGEIVGTFALLPSPEVTYNVIYDGQWLNDEPYYVIHRIARVAVLTLNNLLGTVDDTVLVLLRQLHYLVLQEGNVGTDVDIPVTVPNQVGIYGYF